jgi:hypothetical protein
MVQHKRIENQATGVHYLQQMKRRLHYRRCICMSRSVEIQAVERRATAIAEVYRHFSAGCGGASDRELLCLVCTCTISF